MYKLTHVTKEGKKKYKVIGNIYWSMFLMLCMMATFVILVYKGGNMIWFLAIDPHILGGTNGNRVIA